MTRPKVPGDRRQRTAQACDMCKRRKQKCNGEHPCQACDKRQSECKYDSRSPNRQSPQHKSFSPLKRESSSTGPARGSGRAAKRPAPGLDHLAPKGMADHNDPAGCHREVLKQHTVSRPPRYPSTRDTPHSTVSGTEDEAEVYTEARMLQAPDGRPMYLGASAPLSGLQLLRAIVESAFGQCDFTTNLSRHKIVENIVGLLPSSELPGVFPSHTSSKILVKAFFYNTNGLVDLFNRADFERAVAASLNEPFIARPKLQCLMYLTFAIGLILATPEQQSEEEEIIRRFRQSGSNIAETLFRNAKRLVDPLTTQENADFWSVQILYLMSVYMLSTSRRNAAYSYLGMAVQSAFGLGLHRGRETHVIFPHGEQALRRNVWRSLFVLDRFLAVALGRPTMIREDDCSSDSLEFTGEPATLVPTAESSLSVAVEMAKVTGRILQKMYSTRRVSVQLGLQFSTECSRLKALLRDGLHWDRAIDCAASRMGAVPALHLNLYYCHIVLLYTRPFFLFLLKKDQVDGVPPARFDMHIQQFSRTCVTISEHTVGLVHGAHTARYLPRRNPFVIHFLFAASLIILGNEFAGLHPNPEYRTQISKILAIMSYCSKADPQADRLLYILRTFDDVAMRRRHAQGESDHIQSLSYPVLPVGPHSTAWSMSDTAARQMSDVAFSDASCMRSNITTPGPPIVAVNPTVGTAYPGVMPMALDTSLPSGAISGTSQLSSGSFSQPAVGGMPGRRTSNGSISISTGEDAVSFEQLWWGPRRDPSAGVPLFQTPTEVPSAQKQILDMGPFGIYSVFMHRAESVVQADVGESGVPCVLQSLLSSDIEN